MKKVRFDLGVHAGTLLTMAGGKPIPAFDQFVGVKDGKIVEVGRYTPARKKESRKFLDGSHQVCLPGLINGHTHLPMTLFRGLEDDVPFHTWLFERILPLENELVSRAFVRDGTDLGALESIRFGVTTVNEMYFYAAEAAARLDAAGLRGIVSQPMAKFPLPEDKILGTDKFKLAGALAKKFRGHPRIEIALGPHAPYSCDDEMLRRVGAYAREHSMPVHIHVSETEREVEESRQEFGKSPVQRLADLGVLGKRTFCAHCVHLDESDRRVLRQSGATAIYNPDSNMKLGSGISPVTDFLRRGIPVAFGTDGAASNNDLSVFGAMDIGTKLQKLANRDSTAMIAAQALRMATIGGAEALGIESRTGSLEVGKSADLILVDLRLPHLQPVYEAVSHLVYATSGLEVSATVCEGKLLYAGGKYLTLDVQDVLTRAASWQRKVSKSLKAKKQLTAPGR
ncbi:MAG: amidohydrolase family protein [Bacteriovoracia bacterium]